MILTQLLTKKEIVNTLKETSFEKKKETMTWLLEYRLERKAHAHLYKA